MQACHNKSAALAALVLLLAPAVSQAADAAPGLPPAPLSAAASSKLPASDLSSPKFDKAAKPASEDALRETDVWGRIRTGYAIPDLNNDLVAKHVTWYSTRPEYIARTTARASRYLFHVVTELEKRGMPTELALLPFIESAFNPQALSSATRPACGSSCRAPGKRLQPEADRFKDDRRGVLASTDAALTICRPHDMFGDWQLALAAYNWGEGSVQKRHQAQPGRRQAHRFREPGNDAGRDAQLRAQAAGRKNIIANPEQYGLSLPLIDNQPYFTAVDKTSDIDLTIAAHLAELSVDEFKALNPQFNRPVITGGEQTKILLPQENAAKFHLNLAQWGRALSTWTTHKITSARERIDTLASRFHTTPEVLRQANNIPQKSVLKAGSTILVPKISTSANIDIAPEVADNATVAFEAERSGKSAKGYKLAKGHKAGKEESPVALVKAHVPRHKSKHRNDD